LSVSTRTYSVLFEEEKTHLGLNNGPSLSIITKQMIMKYLVL